MAGKQLHAGFKCVMRVALATLISLPLFTNFAFADVRPTDNLDGITVEDRGLSAALCPNVEADHVILLAADGELYYERDADERVRIASLTKIMTAIVAIEYAPMDTIIYVNQEAASVGEATAGLKSGDSMTLETALNGLLVSSGNDAAIAIADTLGASMLASLSDEQARSETPIDKYLSAIDPSMSNIEAFVAVMNAKASDLGMENTLFSNPHGLDIGIYDTEMYSTARDVSIMAAYAMDIEIFRNIVAQDKTTLVVKKADGTTEKIKVKSTDMLIGTFEGACGIKTGYTEHSGYSFAGACCRDGVYVYSVLLGSDSNQQRFEDARVLYNWFYDNHLDFRLAQSPITVLTTIDGQAAEVPVVAEVSHKSWLDRTFKATIADPNATVSVFSFDGNVSQEFEFFDVRGNVEVGEKVGAIRYYQHNEEIATADIIAAESSPAPGPIETFKIGLKRLWNKVTGQPSYAETIIHNNAVLIYDKDI